METELKKIFQRMRVEQPENPAKQDWTTQLSNISQGISEITQSTEQHFLDIGSKLQNYVEQAQQMARLSAEITSRMSGEQIQESIDGLQQILQKLKNHLSNLEQHFDSRSDVLTHYLDVTQRIASALEDFRMLVLNLSMLGFLTRVENAHISNTNSGFGTLAQDVKQLGVTIQDKSHQIIGVSGSLSQTIEQTFHGVNDLEQSRRSQAKNLLDTTIHNHQALANRVTNATQASLDVNNQTRDIARSINEIVSSMQFNDITRQQIEHVKEAIEAIIQNIGDLDDDEMAAIIMKLVRLQSAQLNQSKDELTGAVTNIIRDLQIIGNSVAAMIDNTSNVAWSSDTDGLAFMEEIDSGIGSIIATLSSDAQEQDRIDATMNSVSGSVEDMSGFVDEIEMLGLQLQLIALNARIKAAHIGLEGVTLDTISGAIYELSKNSRKDTKELSKTLSDVTATAKDFNSRSRSEQQNLHQEVSQMMHDMQQMLSYLHHINDEVLELLTEMNITGNQLIENISTTTTSITIHKLMDEALSTNIDSLNEIADNAELCCKNPDITDSSIIFQDLIANYTMQSERAIHRQHFNVAEEETEDIVTQETSEYGDNVELF